MEGSSKLFCSSKSAWSREQMSVKFVDSSDARRQTRFASRDIDLRFRSNETRKWVSEGHLDDTDSGTCHSAYL